MKFEYDQQTDSLYIHFTDGAGADVHEITEDIIADVNAEGKLVGLDIQHASKLTDLDQFMLKGLNPSISPFKIS